MWNFFRVQAPQMQREPVSQDNENHLKKIHVLTSQIADLERQVQDAEVRGLFVSQGALTVCLGLGGFLSMTLVVKRVAQLIALFVGTFGILGFIFGVVLPYLILPIRLDVVEYKNSIYTGLFFSAMGALGVTMLGLDLPFLSYSL